MPVATPVFTNVGDNAGGTTTVSSLSPTGTVPVLSLGLLVLRNSSVTAPSTSVTSGAADNLQLVGQRLTSSSCGSVSVYSFRGAGAVTFLADWGSSQSRIQWMLAAVTNISLFRLSSSSNDWNGVKQAVTATAASGSPLVTLAAATDPSNVAFAAWALRQLSGATINPEAGWTELYDAGIDLSSGNCEVEYNTTFDTTATVTASGSTISSWAGVSLELSVIRSALWVPPQRRRVQIRR